MSDASTQRILTALMANVFSLPPRVERISGQSLKYVKLGDVLALIEEASNVAALSTPEPQTGERDGEVEGFLWRNGRDGPHDAGPWVLTDAIPKNIGDRVEVEPIVRQSALIAERTAREAAERRLAEEVNLHRYTEKRRQDWQAEAGKQNARAEAAERERDEWKAEAKSCIRSFNEKSYELASAEHRLAEVEERDAARPLADWHEDIGDVVWWCWQDGRWLGKPAFIGSPVGYDWPDYHTHWTPHPAFPADRAALRAKPEAHTLVGKEGDQ